MCRLFALRANRPTRADASLLDAPHSLLRQSGCDAAGQRHDSGWGIGYYVEGRPRCERSALPAGADPHYAAAARSAVSATLLAHVRQASVGPVSVLNSHPFVHGRWLFAHNGTLDGFAQHPEHLRERTPAHLRQGIKGDTDSEHAFRYLLGRLEKVAGSPEAGADPEAVGRALVEAVAELADLYPGEGAERSAFNFVLTDGRTLAASRWGRSLSWLERRGVTDLADRPIDPTGDYHAVAVASEPTTGEDWKEVPERTVLLVRPDLTHVLLPIPRP